MFDGPIPGQSLTVEPGSRPWERPPQFVKFDKAMDYMFDRVTSKKAATGILNMLEAGVPLEGLIEGLLMTGVMEGKYTIDMAMLLADPLTRIIGRMAMNADITPKYEKDEDLPPDETFFMLKNMQAVNSVKPKVDAAIQSLQAPTGLAMRPAMGG